MIFNAETEWLNRTMSYTKQNYTETESQNGLHMMRDDLDMEKLGFTVVEVDEGWEGMEHDHEDQGQEEVYFLASGAATLHVDDETIELDEGDAVRISPESSRQLEANQDSVIVMAGAP